MKEIEDAIKAAGAEYDRRKTDRRVHPTEHAKRQAVKHCRDMFIVGSLAWNLLNDRLNSM